jgi:RNA polymerase sigma factor for flagellar operon FliA
MSLQAEYESEPGGTPLVDLDSGLAEAALWERCRSGDADARERLLALHLPYARIVAASYYSKRMHDEIEFGDYLQLATVGLLECVDRYDPATGVQFRTFAARRMHGSLLDGLERMTEKQQQIAARKRLEQQRLESIREGTRAGTPRERNNEQLLAYVADAGLAFALSWLLDGTGMLHVEEKGASVPFYSSVELRQLRERILQLVHSLPAQERRVVHEHYFQERAFQEIAEAMQLTKGRISQIHHRALERLREDLAERGRCDVAW